MPTESPTVITASSTQEIEKAYAALSSGKGGTIRVEAGSAPISIKLNGGGPADVRIEAADPGNPPLVTGIQVGGAENVTVSGFQVDSTGVDRPAWYNDVMVFNSRNVTIEDSVFTSNATERYVPAAGAIRGEDFGRIHNSTDVTISDNNVSGYNHGLLITESIGTKVTGNEITKMQGDGIRMGGVQNTEISGNHMHDFLGSLYNINHDDFIQLWSTNTTLATRDLAIRNNVLDAGDGSAAQSIFLGNEKVGGDPAFRYQNIEVTGNVIHGGQSHGISVYGANDVDVSNNTILWNESALTLKTVGQPGVNSVPIIRMVNVDNGRIDGNITSGIDANSSVAIGDNAIIDYKGASSPNFVGNHFVDALGGGTRDGTSLNLKPDSDLSGKYGSDLTRGLTSSDSGVKAVFLTETSKTDIHTVTFDAGFSVDETGHIGDGYEVRWTLPDGTVLEGTKISHTFAKDGQVDVRLDILKDGAVIAGGQRSIDIQSKIIVAMDFENGAANTSSYDLKDAPAGGSATDDGGWRIGQGDAIFIHRDTDATHDLGSFGLRMDLRVVGGDDGTFVHFHKVMGAIVGKDGTVTFKLTTGDGTFEVDSGDIVVNDGAEYDIAIGYDGATLMLQIDGAVVDTVAATGLTGSQLYHGLVLGTQWGNALEAEIDDFLFGSDPDAVGMFPEISPVVSVLPTSSYRSPQDIGALLISEDFEPANPGAILSKPTGGGISNDSGTQLRNIKLDRLTTDGNDTGYSISNGHNLQIARNTKGLHELEAFSLEMDVTADTSDLQGTLIYFPEVIAVSMNSNGTLGFRLDTDKGRFLIEADASVLADGGTHRIGISYDADTGKMAMQIDGETIAEGDAAGITAPHTYHGLSIGHSWASPKWHDVFEMNVDDIAFASRLWEEDQPAATGIEGIVPNPVTSLVEADTSDAFLF